MPDTKNEFIKKMDALFEKYRICKYITIDFDDSQPEEFENYRGFCELIESLVQKLPELEQTIIKERYMKDDNVLDKTVFKDILLISRKKYILRRKKAFQKIDLYLNPIKFCG